MSDPLIERVATAVAPGGIPVLVDEAEMPIGEQPRRQLTAPDPDPLAGMDVLLSVRRYRERLMKQLRYTAKPASRRLRQIPAVELPGSVDGTPVAYLALAAPSEPWLRDDGWAAVAACDGFAITVPARGAPPERLDFESIRR